MCGEGDGSLAWKLCADGTRQELAGAGTLEPHCLFTVLISCWTYEVSRSSIL